MRPRVVGRPGDFQTLEIRQPAEEKIGGG